MIPNEGEKIKKIMRYSQTPIYFLFVFKKSSLQQVEVTFYLWWPFLYMTRRQSLFSLAFDNVPS